MAAALGPFAFAIFLAGVRLRFLVVLAFAFERFGVVLVDLAVRALTLFAVVFVFAFAFAFDVLDFFFAAMVAPL